MDRTSPFAPNSMQNYSGHTSPSPGAIGYAGMSNPSWSGNPNNFSYPRPAAMMTMNPEPMSPYPSTTLFVGDIPVICNEENIFELFHEYGQIETIQLKKSDRDPQRAHLGYGFVKFAHGEGALRALEAVNGKFFMGRNLRVGWADDKQSGVRVPRIQAKNLDQKKTNQTAQIHVSFSVSDPYFRISEFHLRSVFERYGNLIDIAIKKNVFNEQLGVQSGYGFVHFLLTEEGIHSATRAVEEVNNQVIDNIKYQCKITHSLQVHIFSLRRGGSGGTPGSTATLGTNIPSAAMPQFQQQPRSEYPRPRSTYPASPFAPSPAALMSRSFDYPLVPANSVSPTGFPQPVGYGGLSFGANEFSDFHDPLAAFSSRVPAETSRIPALNPALESPSVNSTNSLYGFAAYSSVVDEALVASTASLSLTPPPPPPSLATTGSSLSAAIEPSFGSGGSGHKTPPTPGLVIEPPPGHKISDDYPNISALESPTESSHKTDPKPDY